MECTCKIEWETSGYYYIEPCSLCSAAPELLGACKSALDLLDKCAVTTREGEAVNALLYTRELRAAIARAEGAAPDWGRVRP